MGQDNVKETLDGVDEEQLSMIVTALQETASCYEKMGMVMVALKMRITAEKVSDIKKVREAAQAAQILGRLMKKEKNHLLRTGGVTRSFPMHLGGSRETTTKINGGQASLLIIIANVANMNT